jgi:hypothetical protein
MALLLAEFVNNHSTHLLMRHLLVCKCTNCPYEYIGTYVGVGIMCTTVI